MTIFSKWKTQTITLKWIRASSKGFVYLYIRLSTHSLILIMFTHLRIYFNQSVCPIMNWSIGILKEIPTLCISAFLDTFTMPELLIFWTKSGCFSLYSTVYLAFSWSVWTSTSNMLSLSWYLYGHLTICGVVSSKPYSVVLDDMSPVSKQQYCLLYHLLENCSNTERTSTNFALVYPGTIYGWPENI